MAFIPESMLLNNDHRHHHHHHHHQDFQGVEFLMRRSSMSSFTGTTDRPEDSSQVPDDDMLDDGSQMLGEKKRRLNLEQVKALEKNFELGNKLESERKMQLARALGLQPRQVAIWFQNRRARWKTKQLEKDYDVLKRHFEAVKANNDALKSQNKKLQTQLMALKNRESTDNILLFNLNKENEGSWSNGSDHENGCEVNLNNTAATTIEDITLYPHDDQSNVKHGHVFFPTPINGQQAATSLSQVLQTSSRVQNQQLLMRNEKIEHDVTPASNEGFCHMFGGIEENPEFWPWSAHQSFN